MWQLRLEQPLLAARGDRLVVRQIAPPDTLGGGLVLDPGPRRHGPSRELLVRLAALERGEAPPEPAPQPRRDPAPVQPAPAPLPDSARELEGRLRDAGVEPPSDAELDPGDLAALRAHGRVVRVSKRLHYHPDSLAEIRARMLALAARHGGAFTLAQVRDELGTSRRYAQALVEHFDSERLTIRRGESHHLRAAARDAD